VGNEMTTSRCRQPVDCTDFVKALRCLLIAKDWAQGRLGRRSGLGSSVISRLLNGRRPPTVEQVFRISVAMSLTRKETNQLLEAAWFLPCPNDGP